MKLTVVIQVVENGYIISYKDIVDDQPQAQSQNMYAPTITNFTTTPRIKEKTFVTNSEEDILSVLRTLKQKIMLNA